MIRYSSIELRFGSRRLLRCKHGISQYLDPIAAPLSEE